MGWNTKVDDWQVMCVGQLGGGAGAGGGVFLFNFRSAALKEAHRFTFVGGGLAAGGNASGLSVPPDWSLPQAGYGDMKLDRPFSLDDLNLTAGRVSTIGAAAALGYSAMYITASTSAVGILAASIVGGTLFHSVYCGGFGMGVGASGIAAAGIWKWTGNLGGYSNSDWNDFF
ncbi:hypothetical protein [Dyella sp.]|uniref:hypothetical protein n=1 Tax=Dyella sp. TaxID=1869338 RepID=UPI002ED0FAE4